ncbi:MAG: cytochrome c maturation protein CcmE [Acidobacteriota bacterium]|nr:MAG: cytochrome c maturation protein CcmE [Acidobacteriota bacterium]
MPQNHEPSAAVEPGVPRSRRRLWKFVIAFGAIALSLGYLITVGLGKSVVPYMTVPEFTEAGKPTHRIRLTGYVTAGSIERSADGLSVRFAIGPSEEFPAGIPVSYRGAIPDTFKEGSEVAVEGTQHGDAFQGDVLLAKCPSRYEAELGEEAEHPEEIPKK